MSIKAPITPSMNTALIATSRFGLGAGPQDVPIDDPRRWIEDQFARYKPTLAGGDLLASATQISQDLMDYQAAQKVFNQAKAAQAKLAAASGTAMPPLGASTMQPITAPAKPTGFTPPPANGMAGTMAPGTMASMAPPPTGMAPGANPGAQPQLSTLPPMPKSIVRDQYYLQAGRRIRNAVTTDTPFVERMVHFWSNHFAISTEQMAVQGLGGLMEFEAIRPHVLGRFEDMLFAVERHPAMLLYLQQAQSSGPGSKVGLDAAKHGRKVGLNENLAREIMELHTLGVRSGYTQADVTEFARALTGWTVTGIARGGLPKALVDPLPVGSFVFVDTIHEPGARKILGKTYEPQGEMQGRAILADFARHPATAQHIATKLARHVVADDPPPSLVKHLAKAYLASDGDLPTVYRALIDAKEAWKPAPAKFRDPWLWTIAMYRALGPAGVEALGKTNDHALVDSLTDLGQTIWRPGSPAGYDDIAASWAAPDALLRRVELASRVAGQAGASIRDPRALAQHLFASDLSPATATAIAQAESPRQGLSLLLVSPEMLRC